MLTDKTDFFYPPRKSTWSHWNSAIDFAAFYSPIEEKNDFPLNEVFILRLFLKFLWFFLLLARLFFGRARLLLMRSVLRQRLDWDVNVKNKSMRNFPRAREKMKKHRMRRPTVNILNTIFLERREAYEKRKKNLPPSSLISSEIFSVHFRASLWRRKQKSFLGGPVL